MSRTRQDLRDEALANLRIVQQADTSATRTRADWVTETLGNLGLNQAAYAGATKTRAQLVTEAMSALGVLQAPYAGGASRTRAQLITEAMRIIGVVQQVYAGNTRTRAQLVSDAMAWLGVVQKTPTVSAGTRTLTDLISQVLFNLGALGEGNTVPSADATVAVTAAATSVARMLDARQVVSISNTNSIDNAYFLPFASIITEAMKEQYGIDPDTTEAAGLIADAKQAELDLKIMTRATLVDGKIDAIAADLRARATATLTVPVVTVPEPYYPELVVIVANEVRGYFEWLGADVAQRAPAEAAASERKLRTITGYDLVNDKVDAVAADLAARAVVTIGVPVVAFPEQYYPSIAAVLADQVKGYFEWLAPDALGRITAEAKTAEMKLRTVSGTALVDDKIDPVAADLKARAVVSLTVPVVTVPEQYFPSLAAIVADSVKGKFDWLTPEVMQRAAAEAAGAEFKLRQVTGTGLVDEKLPSLIGELNARGVCTVSNIEAIPGAWFSALADIAAESVRGRFVVPPEIAQRVTGRAAMSERTLKNLTRTYLVERNIDSIISELAAREIVYLVDDSAIPEEWFPHLAWIVADRCKAKFELDADVIQLAAMEGMNAIATLREQTRGRPSYNTLRTAYM